MRGLPRTRIKFQRNTSRKSKCGAGKVYRTRVDISSRSDAVCNTKRRTDLLAVRDQRFPSLYTQVSLYRRFYKLFFFQLGANEAACRMKRSIFTLIFRRKIRRRIGKLLFVCPFHLQLYEITNTSAFRFLYPPTCVQYCTLRVLAYWSNLLHLDSTGKIWGLQSPSCCDTRHPKRTYAQHRSYGQLFQYGLREASVTVVNFVPYHRQWQNSKFLANRADLAIENTAQFHQILRAVLNDIMGICL